MENVHTGLRWLRLHPSTIAALRSNCLCRGGFKSNRETRKFTCNSQNAIHNITSTNISTNVVYFFPCALHPSAYLVYLLPLSRFFVFRFMWGYLVCWTYTYYVLRKFITITPQFRKVSIEAHPHPHTKKEDREMAMEFKDPKKIMASHMKFAIKIFHVDPSQSQT